MVDIGSDFARAPSNIDSMVKPLLATCITSREEALALVEGLSDDLLCTGYQSKAFLRAWLSKENSNPYFLTFAKAGHGKVLLPLEINRHGIATYCGGTHANGNFPVGEVNDIEALVGIDQTDFVDSIKKLTNAPIAIFLERQHETFEGIKNPFSFANSSESPNVALSLSLDGGFAKVQERHHGKRKRKRQRSHMRKLEPLGQVDVVHQVPCEEVRDVLSSFFAMKAERFKKQGICDVFEDPQVREMFAQMFMASCNVDKPKHLLKTLKLDGKVISVIGCTVHRNRITVEFGTFDNEYAACGPGDILFFHAIEDACENELEIFDFGIGDEFYKRSWCEIETWHRDTIVGLSAIGNLIAAYKIARGKFVRNLKANQFIWSKIKKARKHLGWIWCFKA
ncbi:MAG: GNAT family N-acetyltransferase [Pseudomonadota bacterium]